MIDGCTNSLVFSKTEVRKPTPAATWNLQR